MHFMVDKLIRIYIAWDTHGSEFDNDYKVPEIGVKENSILLLVNTASTNMMSHKGTANRHYCGQTHIFNLIISLF